MPGAQILHEELAHRRNMLGRIGSSSDKGNESSRKNLVVSTKKLSKHIEETLGVLVRARQGPVEAHQGPPEPPGPIRLPTRKVKKLLAEIFDNVQLALGKEHMLIATGHERLAHWVTPLRLNKPVRGVRDGGAEVKGFVDATLELDGTALLPLLRPQRPGR